MPRYLGGLIKIGLLVCALILGPGLAAGQGLDPCGFVAATDRYLADIQRRLFGEAL